MKLVQHRVVARAVMVKFIVIRQRCCWNTKLCGKVVKDELGVTEIVHDKVRLLMWRVILIKHFLQSWFGVA